MRRVFPAKARSDEFFLHMTNGVYGASGSPIFRCVPNFNAGKLLGVDVSAPSPHRRRLHPAEQREGSA